MAGYHCLMPLASFPCCLSFACCLWHHSLLGINQSYNGLGLINNAPAHRRWRANNQIAQGNALGVICRVMLLPCLGAACFVPYSLRVLPWAGSLLPLSGAHSAEQLLLLGVLMPGGATPGLRIRMNEDLSNNIRILAPN